MLDKILNAVEPFALFTIVLAGASMAGWVTFTNSKVVGIAVFFCGILLICKYIYQSVRTQK